MSEEFKSAKAVFQRYLRCESGATAIEYGLIVSIISLAIVSAAQAIGLDLVNLFSNLAGYL